MIGMGTIINVIAVLLGGGLGLLLGSRLPKRIRDTIMHALGMLTIVLGIHLSLETNSILIVLASLLIGGILGELVRIERRIERAGAWIERKTSSRSGEDGEQNTALEAASGAHIQPSSRFSYAFLTASLVFCVGPMTILGSIQDGLSGDYTLLAIKAVLDAFAGLAFASTLGPGVIFSAITVFVYQGLLTLSADWISVLMNETMIAEMTATGGVLMVGLGLGLLEIKRIKTGNLLPALLFAPLIVALLEWGAPWLPFGR